MSVSRKTSPHLILLPLMVMLLLTVLMGLTAYEVTDSWRQSAETITRNAVQDVMLTNIRWGLIQARGQLAGNPEKARKTWEEVREQVSLLTQASPHSTEFMALKTFMAHDENIGKIDFLLGQPFLNVRLQQSNRNLAALEQSSGFITNAVFACMIALGSLLTAITAWDLTRLLGALVQSRDLNIKLQEEERRRIAQDLHDGVVQELIDLKRGYSPDKVDHLINNLRRVCHNLKPQVLDDLGLAAALEFLADDLRQSGLSNVQVNVDREGLSRLPQDYELPLFRVVQELFSNIKHHAQATQATLNVSYDPAESPMLSGTVMDNGRGFDPKKVTSQNMGLAGVRERIQQLDGRLSVDTAPGQGSRFRFQIPVKGVRHAPVS